MALDPKVLREKSAEEELAVGTPIAQIPCKGQATVDAVLAWVNGVGGPTSPPPPPVPPAPPQGAKP